MSCHLLAGLFLAQNASAPRAGAASKKLTALSPMRYTSWQEGGHEGHCHEGHADRKDTVMEDTVPHNKTFCRRGVLGAWLHLSGHWRVRVEMTLCGCLASGDSCGCWEKPG